MRRLIIAIVLLSAPSAFAVVPQFWKTSSAEDFLAGDVEGFSITSRGELRLGPMVRKSVGFTDPFVLSQTSAPNGDRFFGTGNDGKVYRLRGTDLKAIYTAPEPEIYAVEFHNGQLFAGSSPNGRIYRIDPESGKATTFFEPKTAYIWALAFLPDGDLAVGTGLDGKVFRVAPSGSGKSVFDAPESHVRSLAVASDGRILAGGSGQGRIYEIRPDGTSRSLFDSPLTEISTIEIDNSGTGWAAGVTNVLPATAPAKAQPTKSTQQPTGAATTAPKDEPKKDGEGSSGGVEVNFSFDDAAATSSSGAGSSELYRIGTDGFVDTVRKFDREIIYAISPTPDGSVLIATGPQGRIYRFRDHELALIATIPEKQVVSISALPAETLVTTTNSGALYRLAGVATAHSEFRSAVKDADRFSRFGHFKIEGRDLDSGALAISFRSGNTKSPDATWSAWSAPMTALEGTIGAPAARYVQWKLDSARPGPQMAVDSVTLGYVNRNVAPIIDSVSVADPGSVYITSSYPASPQVVEATNPDEYGIFTSLENPREKTDGAGKKVFRKGYRTISWRAHDDNGDSLRYAVSFRRKGDEPWLRLRDNVEETSVNFDTSQLPDGTYEVRVSVSDRTDNPEGALSDSKSGVEFVVDNTPPAIAVSNSGKDLSVRVTDRLSNVGKVEYSMDAQKWIRLTPDDGIADSSDETYTLDRASVTGHFVIIRAVDSFYNVATVTATVTGSTQ